MESGLAVLEMDTENSNGQMAHAMKVNGRIIVPTEKESSPTLMVISTKAIGSMIKLMAMEFTIILMAQCTKDIGGMTCSTEPVKRVGLMALFTRESTWQERNMELAFTAGTMVPNIKESGTRIKSKVSELIVG